ncbi:MAG TPA: YHS domain-containing protein [Thermoplasmata archaeon]|nr:YHS domain-containing protein [Thermoplasmata archaeon]
MATDPICGMKVDERNPATLRAEWGGQTYYFCAESCRATFQKSHPAK